MKKNMKLLITLCVLTLLTIVFAIGTQSFFSNKEINLASDKCYEAGGTPTVESSFLAVNYSFSCQVK